MRTEQTKFSVMSFYFFLFFFREKKDVQGHIIRSLALLDDLGPDGGPTPVLPTHAEPKRRRDDLLILGCDLPFAHDSIARSESIAGRGATPSDRIGGGCGGRRLLGGGPRGEACRKCEMPMRQEEGDEKEEAGRRRPNTTMHNVRPVPFFFLPGPQQSKNPKKKKKGARGKRRRDKGDKKNVGTA